MTFEEFVRIAERIGVGNPVTIELKDGMKFEAKFQKKGKDWYICQNYKAGTSCDDKLGYAHSWVVTNSNDLQGHMHIKTIISRKEVKMKNVKYGVKYDRSTDPVEFFETKKEAEKRITELLDDNDVKKTTICLFEVGEVWEVTRPVTYELVKVK
jgi:hypothetical protein